MITRNSIITELNNRGFHATMQDTTKNGVIFQGIRIKKDDVQVISPVIYTDNIISDAVNQGKTLDDVIDTVIAIYNRNCTPDIDVNLFSDKDFVLSHIYIGIQKTSNENLLKGQCEFEGLETYLYIKTDNLGRSYSFKIMHRHLDIIGITSEEAWENAENNTFANTVIMNMGDMLANMMGHDTSDITNSIPMYVVTNKSGFRGSANILDRTAITKLANDLDTYRFYCLPSSVSEMLLIPMNEATNGNIKVFSDMVKEINNTEFDNNPEDRLVDKAFVIEI